MATIAACRSVAEKWAERQPQIKNRSKLVKLNTMKQVLKVMIVVLCLATSFVSKAIATDEITLTVSF